MEHASDITKIGMRGLFRIPSVDIASHSTTSLAEVLSSEGGTRKTPLNTGFYRVGKFRAKKTTQETTQLLTVGNVTPTLLATIWDELSEAERSHINEIVVHHLQMNMEESVEAEILPEVI